MHLGTTDLIAPWPGEAARPPDVVPAPLPRTGERADTRLLLACRHCDTLYRDPRLTPRQIATCRRCGQVLARGSEPDPNVTFALAITAGVLWLFANLYPIITVDAQGRHSEATLSDAVIAMAQGYTLPIAVFLAATMIVVPLLQIVLLGWVTGHARRGRRAPGFARAMRVLEHARPWSMVEVFLIGALVAIVKLSSLLEVRPGAGIFALLGLTFLITFLAGRSTRSLWRHDSIRAGETRPVRGR